MKLIHLTIVIIVAFCISVIFAAAVAACTYILVTKVKAVENEFDVGCKVNLTTDMSLSDNTWTDIIFDSEIYDTDNMHDCVVNPDRVYIVSAGKYTVSCNVQYWAMSNGQRGIRILINGECPAGEPSASIVNGASSGSTFINATCIIELEVGDYISYQAWHDTTGSLKIYPWSNLSVGRIGIGGDSMDFNVILPTGFYVMIFGLALIFLSFFIKSPLINLAVIACMVSCIFEPAFKDTYYQTGCVILAIWSAIVFFVRMTKVFSGGDG